MVPHFFLFIRRSCAIVGVIGIGSCVSLVDKWINPVVTSPPREIAPAGWPSHRGRASLKSGRNEALPLPRSARTLRPDGAERSAERPGEQGVFCPRASRSARKRRRDPAARADASHGRGFAFLLSLRSTPERIERRAVESEKTSLQGGGGQSACDWPNRFMPF